MWNWRASWPPSWARRPPWSSPPASRPTPGSSPAWCTRASTSSATSYIHACIMDGCLLSHGTLVRYDHNNMADLEEKLARIPAGGPQAHRHRRRVLHGRRHLRPARHREAGPALRRPGHGRRRPRHRRAGPGRRGHRRPLRPHGRGGPDHGHLLQVPGGHRRLHRRQRADHQLPHAHGPALHVLRLGLPGQRGGGAGRP